MRPEFLAHETFQLLGDTSFSFLWKGEPVFGYYYPEGKGYQLITHHYGEILEEINDWLNEILEERFEEEDEYDQESGD